MLPGAMVGDALQPGLLESGLAHLADLLAAAVCSSLRSHTQCRRAAGRCCSARGPHSSRVRLTRASQGVSRRKPRPHGQQDFTCCCGGLSMWSADTNRQSRPGHFRETWRPASQGRRPWPQHRRRGSARSDDPVMRHTRARSRSRRTAPRDRRRHGSGSAVPDPRSSVRPSMPGCQAARTNASRTPPRRRPSPARDRRWRAPEPHRPHHRPTAAERVSAVLRSLGEAANKGEI